MTSTSIATSVISAASSRRSSATRASRSCAWLPTEPRQRSRRSPSSCRGQRRSAVLAMTVRNKRVVQQIRCTPDERGIADRVQRGQPKLLARDWRHAAEHWCGERGINAERFLDALDEIAALKLYAGADWDTAQAEAWAET